MDTPPDSQRKAWARLSTLTSFVSRICFFKARCSDSDSVNGFIVIPPAFDFTRVRLGGIKKILSTYLDTNIVINACKKLSWDHLDVLSLIRTRNHTVALDTEGKILAEYRRNCSEVELFEKWYKEIWQRVAPASGQLENRYVTHLRKLGCHEPSDHVFVAVARRTG